MKAARWILTGVASSFAASAWLVYTHGGQRSRGSRAKKLARTIDPIIRRADREAAEGTEYLTQWTGPRRVA